MTQTAISKKQNIGQKMWYLNELEQNLCSMTRDKQPQNDT